MKKPISSCLVLIISIVALSSCNLLNNTSDKPTEELDFHLLDDNTYGVSAGAAKDFERIVIPETYDGKAVTKIMDNAFFEAKNIKSITAPDSITSIGELAFAECSSLKNLTIGNGVTFIGQSAFNNCHDLEYNEFDNAYYLGNETNPYVVLVKAKVTASENITSCKINDNTKIICSTAFSDSDNLKNITIPDGVVCIGEAAFSYCDSLISITVPNSVTSLGKSAFNRCENLESVKIGSGVTSINMTTFLNCGKLETVELPQGITNIDDSAFCNCSKLKQIIFDGTEAEWNAINKHTLWDSNSNDYTVTYNGQ